MQDQTLKGIFAAQKSWKQARVKKVLVYIKDQREQFFLRLKALMSFS